MADEPMTAAQINALAKFQADLTQRVMTNVELRKWAIEQTVRLLARPETDFNLPGVMELVRAMHAFLIEKVSAEKSEF